MNNKRKFHDHLGNETALSLGHYLGSSSQPPFVWVTIEKFETGQYLNVSLSKNDAIELAKKLRIEIKKI